MYTHLRSISALLPCLTLLATSARADLVPEWTARLPVGATLSSGLRAMVVDAAGVTYVAANGGTSNNNDVLTAAYAPDGSLLWSRTYNGTQNWHDQARGIALGPSGSVFVTGNTPGPGTYANVLLLEYDSADGTLLKSVQYSSGPGLSEHGASVAVDALGNAYVAGGTVGDGGDAMVMKFDPAGNLVWKDVWDGPAWGPYSQDNALEILIDPFGDPVVMVHGVMNSLHPDYVVFKYAAGDGSELWMATWGVNGGDFATDMEIDELGDVYVTGTGIDFIDKYSTIKLRGADGALLWQFYDSAEIDNSARALTLDGEGGVYITGAVDPDGDHSNFNDNFYTVKRDATSGALLWTHSYGANCIGCYDVPSDVQVDGFGNVFVAGGTSSPPYASDTITLVLDSATGLETDRGVVSGASLEAMSANFIRFDAAFNVYEGGRSYNVNTGEVEVALLKYPALDPSFTTYCATSPNSLGSGARIGASGSSSVSANDLALFVTGASASQFGLFYYGPNQILQPFGDGFRCVGGGVFRLDPPQATSPAGAASRALDLTQPPANAGPGAILAGSQWNFQFWYRDPAFGGATFNLSDGLSVDFLP